MKFPTVTKDEQFIVIRASRHDNLFSPPPRGHTS
jgi:hypothetical protein